MKAQFLLRPLLLGACLAALPLPGRAQPTDLASVATAAARYDSNQSTAPLRQLEARVREALAQPALRPVVESALCTLLAPDATLEAKRFACRQLGVIGSERSLPALAPLLTHEETASLACLALSTYPPGRADAILRAALPATRDRTRLQIIDTLGDRRDPNAVSALAALAREADLTSASAAVAALAKIGDAPARKALDKLHTNRSAELASAFWDADLRLAQQLVRRGERKAAAPICDALLTSDAPAFIQRGAFDLRLQCDRDGGAQRIRATLAGSEAVLKPVALAAVRRLPARTTSTTFARLLPSLPEPEQIWLLDSLAARNDAAARAALAECLATARQPAVRQTAAQALGRIGDADAVRPLAQALATADAAETRTLITALSTLPGTPAVETALLAELRQAPTVTRPALINALAGRRSPAVYAALLAESSQSDLAVARAAYRALSRATTGETLPALLDRFVTLPDRPRREAMEVFVSQAVLHVEPPAARSSAVRAALAKATDLDTRLALLRLLPACGDASALSLAQSARTDPEARVRDTAVATLAEWPTTAAWEALGAIYRQAENESQRTRALRGLTRLVNEDDPANAGLVSRYESLLAGARGAADLKLILGAMVSARQSGVLALALPLLSNAAVRPEAELAVKRIAETTKAQDPAAAQAALERLAGPN